MKVVTGTSGFSYPEWKGSFYPADLPQARMLPYYASRLGAVEINNTFYRMPSEKLLSGWAAQAPPGFSFILKASQRITHQKRLKDAGELVDLFFATASVLGERLGPVLFQLPPNMKKDAARLQDFLALLPSDRRAAFEFRHPSWFDEETYTLLRARGAALCIAEAEDLSTPLVATAGWGYLRLRRQDYDDAMLHAWAERLRAQAWSEAYVFFKHEDAAAGPRLAARFSEMTR
jgi:uncharacterized protein YecE (DUF72 family)